MTTHQTSMTISERKPTVLQTAVVKASRVGDTSDQIKCRILLDSGSQRSYITWKVARSLKLSIEEKTKLTIFTFGAKRPQELQSPVVRVQIQSRTGNIIVIHANCVEFISQGGIPHQELNNVQESYVLADDGSLKDQLDILIGNDYYFSTIKERKIKLDENLFLVDSALGWLLSGQINFENINELSVITYAHTSNEIGWKRPDLPIDNGDIKKLWELEAIGITDSPKANRDEQAVKYFNETTQNINNRYTVSWPWIDYPPDLPNNFGLAFGRLTSLIKRMDKTTLSAYDETLKDQMDRGIIELVPDSEKISSSNVIHYLPHHGVQQKGKPIRIVYDASSSSNDSKSLNQCLYCGPLMLEDLTSLLLKFRSHQIGLSADIEKAFLQIALHERDRDVTRFLWVKDTLRPVSKGNLVSLRFCRVPFGIISSPFLLNASIKHHLSNSSNQQIKEKAEDIYVDNLITGCRSTNEALGIYKDFKETFHEISMNLRDWSSNSEEFMRSIPDSCKDKSVKILGLEWNINKDTLRLRFKNENANLNTKRGVLKVVASVYDPCGYAIPSLLAAKLFLQELWKMKIKWDSPFSKELTEKWLEIRTELDNIGNISINRCYARNVHENSYELHCFTDASLKAYAASVFLVNGPNRSFIIGKSRLVPVKDQENLKIPRLELLGVLIGCRLVDFVLKSLHLKITRQILWTDSQIVIEWYKSNKLLPPFVSKRIQEIKNNPELEIRYIPSEINPADVGTRPACSKENTERWLNGPQFIVQSQDTWPCNTEIPIGNTYSFSTGEGPTEQEQPMDVDKPDERVSVQLDINTEINELDSEVITDNKGKENQQHQDSKVQEIRNIQSEHFTLELEGKETSLSRNLGLFKDIDDILRCKGRLKNADWSFDKRYPILIPRNTDFTNKLIMNTHYENKHVGVNHTLSIIRQSYWIPQGKSQVQQILKKCPVCVKHGGGPYKLPPTPALPKERVNYSSPFTYIGMDYMGPLIVNNGDGKCKRWICLYTCLAVRAIHLEVVHDLSAEEGLLALRRMISCRGVPDLITSDNATHFKLMSEILKDQYCVDKEIRWNFIPQLAPWFGGYYERLIGIVKNCLKRTLDKWLLKDNQLVTVVKEIEAVVNTRPLTSVDSELEYVLKPSDFLTMGKTITMDTSYKNSSTQGTITKSDLIKSWKRALTILEEFKDMFTNRYLLSLRERYWHGHRDPRVTSNLTPKLGQIVQIKGDSKNRTGWKVGKIVSLCKGGDGLCRSARVNVNGTEFTRSIAHLYPLEIEDGEENCVNNSSAKKTPYEDSDRPAEEYLSNDDDEAPIRAADEVDADKWSSNLNELNQKDSEEMSTDDGMPAIAKSDEKEPKSIDSVGNELVEPDQERRPRRLAAARALGKIQEWTRNLPILLQFPVGSVATSAK